MVCIGQALNSGPYTWTRTSQAFWEVLSRFVKPGDSVLEFGSATGHISYRLAGEGVEVSLLDVRPEPIREAHEIFARSARPARFHVGSFLEHEGSYDLVWNSGLLQCLGEDERRAFAAHTRRLAPRLLLFYPDTDDPRKARGADAGATPGVGSALEHSVASLPLDVAAWFERVRFGRLEPRRVGLAFPMLWVSGEAKCASE